PSPQRRRRRLPAPRRRPRGAGRAPRSASSRQLLSCKETLTDCVRHTLSSLRKRAEAGPLLGLAVAALALEHLRLELLEQLLAAPQPAACLVLVGRPEPVALPHTGEPGADLLELHPDLLRLLVRVVLAEVLELDLLDEVDLAVLDDLGVVLGRLVDEQL